MVRRHNLAMPSKKKKYNARFPAGRIKKIMQTDEEIGKVAQAVPIIISRTLELFVESLLTKSVEITNKRNAKTLSPSHMKQCILAESRFDFLRDLVKNIPDASHVEDRELGQTVSADSSPNANRYSDSGSASVNPGPSNTVKRPRRLQKKENGQSSDSGSDHEPGMKRIAKNPFGNGRNPPKGNFDEELKAFKQKMNHRSSGHPSQTNQRKSTETDSKDFVVPNDVNIPLTSGESSSSNINRQKLFNFYTETLPDTSEDDEKDKRKHTVIQANPEYAIPPSFGFYKAAAQNNAYSKNSEFVQPSQSKSRTSSDSCVPKLHIDLSQGFSSPATISVIPNDVLGTTPMYHIDLSAMPIPNAEHPYTPNILCPTQSSVISNQRFFGNPSPKKAPPPLQTISLRRSASLPESNVSNFARPISDGAPRPACPSWFDSNPRSERSSLNFDKSSRKNEPPLLLPINLVQKSVIASPSSTTIPVKPPAMEIDEDYDT